MAQQSYPCENCKFRASYDKNPKSLKGRDEQTALDIAGAYGTGMGNMEGTCGALVGAGMIVGLATKDRNQSRVRMKEIMEKFQERNGATRCRLPG